MTFTSNLDISYKHMTKLRSLLDPSITLSLQILLINTIVYYAKHIAAAQHIYKK